MDVARVRKMPIKREMVKKETEKLTTLDIEFFPKYLRPKARKLLDELTEKGLKWNTRGEIYYRGHLLPDTNVLELVNDALKLRKYANPTGWQAFSRILRDLKISKELIQNPRRVLLEPSDDLPEDRDDDDDDSQQEDEHVESNSQQEEEYEESVEFLERL